ncbi:hypothetical protein TNCV_471671 [Trichonephila clavipes]|nr:hypothetical protein TNCV_471671 [Trichonephila clavipes]
MNSTEVLLYNLNDPQAKHPQDQTGNKTSFLLHHDNARPHCSAQAQNVPRKPKFPMVHSFLSAQIWLRRTFGLFPKLKEMLKRSTVFQRMPKFRQPCANKYAANQNLSSWTE